MKLNFNIANINDFFKHSQVKRYYLRFFDNSDHEQQMCVFSKDIKSVFADHGEEGNIQILLKDDLFFITKAFEMQIDNRQITRRYDYVAKQPKRPRRAENKYFYKAKGEINLMLQKMLASAIEFEASERMGYHDCSRDIFYEDFNEALEDLKKYIDVIKDDAERIRYHICQFDSYDYCRICRCDGRA